MKCQRERGEPTDWGDRWGTDSAEDQAIALRGSPRFPSVSPVTLVVNQSVPYEVMCKEYATLCDYAIVCDIM